MAVWMGLQTHPPQRAWGMFHTISDQTKQHHHHSSQHLPPPIKDSTIHFTVTKFFFFFLFFFPVLCSWKLWYWSGHVDQEAIEVGFIAHTPASDSHAHYSNIAHQHSLDFFFPGPLNPTPHGSAQSIQSWLLQHWCIVRTGYSSCF